jgi:hypothetical protein
MEDRGLYATSLGITLVKRNTPFLARNCLSRLEFYRLESVRSLCFSGGGRRCRFRHAHPGATSGLCSLLGDLPPPPFFPLQDAPLLGWVLPTSTVFSNDHDCSQDGHHPSVTYLLEGSPCSSKREKSERFEEMCTGKLVPAVAAEAISSSSAA